MHVRPLARYVALLASPAAPALCAALLAAAPGTLHAQATTTPPETAADTAPAAADTAPPAADTAARIVTALRVDDGAIRVDGELDEDVWRQAPVATGFTVREPESGAPASERTEFRVLYSAQALYVGVRAYDTQPHAIRGELTRRDQRGQTDEIAVYLDTYRDRRTAFMFAVNPRGSIRDVYIFDDMEWRQDASWDPVWQVRTTVDSLGWTAEFRIPLTQLRFDSDNTEWGIQLMRRHHRTAEVAYWAPYAPESSGFVSLFGAVQGLDGLAQPRRLEARPYSVVRQRMRPEPAGVLYAPRQQSAADIGMDLQYGVTSDITLDLTVNPDFGQVEADPAVVNLTAFESFFPERRPFFVEGSGLFSRYVPGGEPFYSRRIGRRPQGFASPPAGGTVELPEAARILGAAKVTGKTGGGLGVGLLGAVTAEARATLRDADGLIDGHAAVEPRTYSFVGRVEQDFRAGSHTIGAMVTALRRDDVESMPFLPTGSYVALADGLHRWRANTYVLRWAFTYSHTYGSTDAILAAQRNPLRYYQRPDAPHLGVDAARTSLSGHSFGATFGKESGAWQYGVSYEQVSAGLDLTELGFQFTADERSLWLNGRYLRSQPQWLFRNWALFVGGGRTTTTGGELVRFMAPNIGFNATFRNNWQLFGNPMNLNWQGNCTTCLRGGPLLRTDVSRSHFLGLSTDRRRPVSLSMNVNGTSYFDSPRWSAGASPTLFLRPSPVLNGSVGLGYFVNRNPVQFVARRMVQDTVHYLLGDLDQRTLSITTRANWTLSPTLSLELYAQPFVSAGSYARFHDVTDPRSRSFAGRFRVYGDELSCVDGQCTVDVSGDGAPDFTFGQPDFNFRQLRSTFVARWEYRPGSVLFFAWQQGRSAFDADGTFRGFSDLRSVLGEAGDHTFLIKANYWLSF